MKAGDTIWVLTENWPDGCSYYYATEEACEAERKSRVEALASVLGTRKSAYGLTAEQCIQVHPEVLL